MNSSNTSIATDGLTLPGITHHRIAVNGTHLHYVSAGDSGSPILMVHGFPETWWTFHKVIPLLAAHHRVFAVDLRGFGDSDPAGDDHNSKTAAEDLRQLIAALDLGPVHLTAQDISGGAAFRLAVHQPEVLRSFTAIEMGLAGFGLERLADVTAGGAWHIGLLAAPGVPALLLTGREREFLQPLFQPPRCATPGAFTAADIEEFCRTYARSGGWHGAAGLYRSMLQEGAELKALAETTPLTVPAMAICAGGGPLTADTLAAVTSTPPLRVQIDGVGHYAAMEAPQEVAAAIAQWTAKLDVI